MHFFLRLGPLKPPLTLQLKLHKREREEICVRRREREEKKGGTEQFFFRQIAHRQWFYCLLYGVVKEVAKISLLFSGFQHSKVLDTESLIGVTLLISTFLRGQSGIYMINNDGAIMAVNMLELGIIFWFCNYFAQHFEAVYKYISHARIYNYDDVSSSLYIFRILLM